MDNLTTVPPRINTTPRKLSDEDHVFIKQLVTLDPTIFKHEIHDKLYQYSNTPLTSISTSTLSRTVRHRLGELKWTHKCVQQSNRSRWSHGNILYTRNFMDYVGNLNVFDIHFVDESGFSVNSGTRYYGSSEIGSKALHIAKHSIGPNYTLFLMIGLNNKFFAYVTEGASDSNKYIEFIHQAVNSYDQNGEPVLYPGCCIVSDRALIHGRLSMQVLEPYLAERNIDYFYLPSYSPTLNPCEGIFSYLKFLTKSDRFQQLLDYYVPTAIHTGVTFLSPELIYRFFKDVSCNYMNL